MGQIINIDTQEGELPDALTETGRGGLLSDGYLAERPAIEAVEDDETAQFVVTNRKRGVTVEAGSTRQVTPGSRYRTVVVVTDRRVVAIVGTGKGDERLTVALSEIADVETKNGRRHGRLTIEHEDGTTWRIPTDRSGLDDVESYIGVASETWRTVEELLAPVEERLGVADERRRAGKYDAAMAALDSTRDRFEDARAETEAFSVNHRGTALRKRFRDVESNCRVTVASIRTEKARAAAADAERRYVTGQYDAAQTAYERARDAYDAALQMQADEIGNRQRLEAERERVVQSLTELQESPLRQAIAADKAAVAAEEPTVAGDHWERALARYREALALDPDDEDKLTGDPDRIRERTGEIAQQLTAIQRSVGHDAMRAGDWYTDTNQYDDALAEFERAAEAIETALSTAREWYPDAITHLETERDALAQRIERVEARRRGESVDDRIETDDEPEYEVTASLGDIDEPTDIESSIDPPATDATLTDATAERLRNLPHDSVTDVVVESLNETNWSVRSAPSRAPFDLLGTRGTELMGVIVHTGDGTVPTDTIRHCAEVTGAGGTDSVMLATTAIVEKPTERLASELGVRIIRAESLAAIVDAGGVALPNEDLLPQK